MSPLRQHHPDPNRHRPGGAPPELIGLLGFKVWYSYPQTDVLGAELAGPAAALTGEMKP